MANISNNRLLPTSLRESRFSMAYSHPYVNIRLTHSNKSAVARRVIIASGMIGQDVPATLYAVSEPVGQANAAHTYLVASGSSHGAIGLNVGQGTRQSRP
jgi:hypothetical protein